MSESRLKFYMVEAVNEKDDDGFPLYWCNLLGGWVDFAYADIFNEGEKREFNLPIGGRWVEREN